MTPGSGALPVAVDLRINGLDPKKYTSVNGAAGLLLAIDSSNPIFRFGVCNCSFGFLLFDHFIVRKT